MAKLLIIVGSTRPGRAADAVTPWVVKAAQGRDAFEVEVADLRDWPLPHFAETQETVGDINDPTYSEPLVKAWNNKVGEADAFIVITPEYNHSVPGVLKNAIDTVWLSFGFRNKPVAAVGYSGGVSGAMRSIEHLAHVFVEAEAVPLRNTVVLPYVQNAFDESGEPKSPLSAVALGILLDDLTWWTTALGKARADGELVPGTFRMYAAMQAATASA
ncbi:MAG TPA: NAD(P)H-dependent oxidoreductase [Trebonia sp.]|jgi:NAD(P)H-dependent FMN reductase|nr:NAD(P)H-dependent oxidoreductase [Trebonia sp.]